MNNEDFIKFANALGYKASLEDGEPKVFGGPGQDDGNRVRDLEPLKRAFERFSQTDTQGRGVFGSKAYDNEQSGRGGTFVDANGVTRFRVGQEAFHPQWEAVGGKPSDLTYDPEYGYSIPLALQDKWKERFNADGALEKITGMAPVIMGSILGGAAASGALGGVGAEAGINAGGLDGILGDSIANYSAGMGANNAFTTAGALGAVDPITGLLPGNIAPSGMTGPNFMDTNFNISDYFGDGGFDFSKTYADIGGNYPTGGLETTNVSQPFNLQNFLSPGQTLTPDIAQKLLSYGYSGADLLNAGGVAGDASGFGALTNAAGSTAGGLNLLQLAQKIPGLSKLLGGDAGKAGGLLGGALGNMGILDALLMAYGLKEGQDAKPTTTIVSNPAWYTQASQDLIAKANGVQPSGAWQGYFDKAGALNDEASVSLPSVDLTSYMNPYLESVLTPMKREADLAKTNTLQGVDTKAAQLNAFGRNRHSLIKNQAAESADRNWNTTEANIRSGAFTNAQDKAQQDLTRKAALGKSYADMGTSVGALSNNDALLPIVAGSTALRGVTPDRTTTTTNPPPSLFGQALGALGTYAAL